MTDKTAKQRAQEMAKLARALISSPYVSPADWRNWDHLVAPKEMLRICEYIEAAEAALRVEIEFHERLDEQRLARIAELEELLRVATDVLKFYADGQWEGKIDRLGYLDSSEWKTTPAEILEDAGAVAREALARLEAKEQSK